VRLPKALVAVLALAACSGPSTPATPSPSEVETPLSSPPQTASGCLLPGDPRSHVYHPQRLEVIQPCISVSGVIDFERKEKDGDVHVGLKLDPQYAGLVNDCNRTCLNGAEHGDLILEVVCALPVVQADAVAACAGYQNPLVIPPVGAHITAVGPYVLDLDHGWLEIHEVTAIGQVA